MDIEAFVIMPNHFHAVVYLLQTEKPLNKLIANGKRFIAYEIIKRLEERNELKTLEELGTAVYPHERRKGQKHKVFEPSFDAKAVYSDEFLMQKMKYIHHNPVRGKWNLAEHYTDYEHSSASFYELGQAKIFMPKDYRLG